MKITTRRSRALNVNDVSGSSAFLRGGLATLPNDQVTDPNGIKIELTDRNPQA
jgi:hypothetical protein